MHKKILGCIVEMEKLAKELEVVFGVTARLRAQVKAARGIDQSVPLGETRNQLSALSEVVLELNVGDETFVQTFSSLTRY